MAETQVRERTQAIGLSPLIRADSGLLQGGGTEGIRQNDRAPLHRGGIWYELWKVMEHFSSYLNF